METKNSTIWYVEGVLTAPAYNVWSKANKLYSDHDILPGRIIKICSNFAQGLILWRLMDTRFVIGYRLLDSVRRCWVRKKKIQVAGMWRVKRMLFKRPCLRSSRNNWPTQGTLDKVVVILIQNQLVIPLWMSSWYTSGQLAYGTLECGSFEIFQQQGSSLLAISHASTICTTFVRCSCLKFYMDWMLRK